MDDEKPTRAVDRPPRSEDSKHIVDRFPAMIAYFGTDGMFSHIPPVGPRLAIGLKKEDGVLDAVTNLILPKGRAIGDKYTFSRSTADRANPVPIYNPEHKAWYLKESKKENSVWVECKMVDGKWAPVYGPRVPTAPFIRLDEKCPRCHKIRADFGNYGLYGDQAFRAHVIEEMTPPPPAPVKVEAVKVVDEKIKKGATEQDVLKEVEDDLAKANARKSAIQDIRDKLAKEKAKANAKKNTGLKGRRS